MHPAVSALASSCLAVSALAAGDARPLLDFKSYPVAEVLDKLLADKTTGCRITMDGGAMTVAMLQGGQSPVKPRVEKSREAQSRRTKASAEVFTPSWLCAKMNDFLEGEILAAKNAKSAKFWQRYVDTRILEITCGEAPFIVSRYDAATGAAIPVKDRIGILDRKLRMVNENAADEKEWMKWTVRAYESVYGYEYQGDSLAIARANLLITFADNLETRWGRKATKGELTAIANRIAWNFWQMDGLTGTVVGRDDPGAPCLPGLENEVLTQRRRGAETGRTGVSPVQGELAFGDEVSVAKNAKGAKILPCVIFDWRARRPVIYNEIGGGTAPRPSQGGRVSSRAANTKGKKTMKFDFAIGNPPYQDETIGDNRTYAPPVYDRFMDETYKVADKVELITPARFLFDAGSTPKAWNKKMLLDSHLKVIWYEPESAKVFPNTDIKGGVAVTYRNRAIEYGEIGHFIIFDELRAIAEKVMDTNPISLNTIIYAAETYRFTDLMHIHHPDAEGMLSTGHKYDFKTSVFESLADKVFFKEKPNDNEKYVQILGLEKAKRVKRWIRFDYVRGPDNFGCYKVFVPAANGSGALGEVLTTPLIGVTQTFIAIGRFERKSEAQACLKYVKTKFARVLLGILKITQHNPGPKWKYVPLQDFTSKSDIDWSGTVEEIDRQLYEKYKLTKAEIKFIETHVKAME